jgi:hypothetical protein
MRRFLCGVINDRPRAGFVVMPAAGFGMIRAYLQLARRAMTAFALPA